MECGGHVVESPAVTHGHHALPEPWEWLLSLERALSLAFGTHWGIFQQARMDFPASQSLQLSGEDTDFLFVF